MSTTPPPDRRRAAALILVLFIVVFLAGLVLVFARQMQTEAIAANNHVSQLRARFVALGVVEAIKADLQASLDAGETPTIGFVDPEAVVIGDGLYWIIRPDFEQDDDYSFGVLPENSRINLRAMPRDILERLPGIDAQVANAIADWRDGDEDVERDGAESTYYLTLDEPYYAKNSGIETLEELLLVRGIDANVLYGEDANRNGVLDPNENDADATDPPDNANGVLEPGLYDYIVPMGTEPNVINGTEPRINIRDENQRQSRLNPLMRELFGDERFAELEAKRDREERNYQNLIHWKLFIEMTDDEFREIEPFLTFDSGPSFWQGINVYEAPAAVLGTLPGLTESDGQRLVDARPDDPPDERSLVWIIDVLGEDKAIAAARWLTVHSYQYSADIVAVSGDGRGFVRWRVTFDTLDPQGRTIDAAHVIYLQDITHLGWPLDPQILTDLRQGMPASEVALIHGSGVR